MKFSEVLDQSEIVLIEGEKGSGKNTFFFYLVNQLINDPEVLVITPYPKDAFLKKISVNEVMIRNFHQLQDKLDYFFLKDNWKELKQKYGYDFLLTDLERILASSQAAIVYFHRIGEYFDIQDRGNIEPFFRDLTKLLKSHRKKTFFTLASSNENYDKLLEILQYYAELDLFLTRVPLGNRINIETVASIYPLTESSLTLTMQDRSLNLSVNKQEGQESSEKENYRILLISDHDRIIKLHQYLLGTLKNIQLNVTSTASDIISKVLDAPDLLIYNLDENDEKMNICELAGRDGLSFKILYLTRREYLRAADRAKAQAQGCSEMFCLSFKTIDYITALEECLGYRFYAQNLASTAKEFQAIKTQEEFLTQIETYITRHCLFCVFIFEYKNSAPGEEQFSGLFRNNDSAFIDHKRKKVFLLSINSQKENAQSLLKKFTTTQNDITFLKAIDCLDLYFGDDKIF
jgi:archaellum biogenesis ATPase FlaH